MIMDNSHTVHNRIITILDEYINIYQWEVEYHKLRIVRDENDFILYGDNTDIISI